MSNVEALCRKADHIYINGLRKINKKQYEMIDIASKEHGIRPSIIKGIYLIENYYRPAHKRVVEYILAFSFAIINIFFNVPIKNYTLGHFQLGITSMLFYSNVKKCKIHDRKIQKLSLEEVFHIIHYCNYNENLTLTCKKVFDIKRKLEIKWGDRDSNIGRIGELYNGTVSYGFLLQLIVEKIEQSDLLYHGTNVCNFENVRP